MHVSCKEWQPKEPRRHFLPQKLLCQPLLWRWRVFNTHFSWQHQRGTRQVKQIYLGRVWSRVWTGFKAARCAAPHACLWLCNPSRCTWSFHSSPCRALNHKSDKFSLCFFILSSWEGWLFTDSLIYRDDVPSESEGRLSSAALFGGNHLLPVITFCKSLFTQVLIRHRFTFIAVLSACSCVCACARSAHNFSPIHRFRGRNCPLLYLAELPWALPLIVLTFSIGVFAH